jgi:hypothetical protein
VKSEKVYFGFSDCFAVLMDEMSMLISSLGFSVFQRLEFSVESVEHRA